MDVTFLPATVLALTTAGGAAPRSAARQDAAPLTTICGMPVPQPATLPQASSRPVLLAITLCFDRQDGSSQIDPQTSLSFRDADGRTFSKVADIRIAP